MDEANIRKYAKLMRELDLTGLEITEGDTVVRLERGAAQAGRTGQDSGAAGFRGQAGTGHAGYHQRRDYDQGPGSAV